MDELGRLNESGHKLYVDIGALLTLLNDSATNFVCENVARHLAEVQVSLLSFIRDIKDMLQHMSW